MRSLLQQLQAASPTTLPFAYRDLETRSQVPADGSPAAQPPLLALGRAALQHAGFRAEVLAALSAPDAASSRTSAEALAVLRLCLEGCPDLVAQFCGDDMGPAVLGMLRKLAGRYQQVGIVQRRCRQLYSILLHCALSAPVTR
jgi:hypothetical protein